MNWILKKALEMLLPYILKMIIKAIGGDDKEEKSEPNHDGIKAVDIELNRPHIHRNITPV